MLNEVLILVNLAAITSIALFRNYGLLIAIPSLLIFLSLGISTESDYDFYKFGYENLVTKEQFPYFSTPKLAAEPGYVLLSAFARSIKIDDFSHFLVFHALIFMSLTYLALRKLGVKNSAMHEVFLLAIPNILPVILYWSPRSALPIPLILLGYSYLSNGARKRGAFISLLACLFHSQYIPYVLFMIIASRQVIGSTIQLGATLKLVFSSVFLLLFLINFGVPILQSVNPIPILALPLSKLHYLSDNYGGVRLSSLVSIPLGLMILSFLSGRTGRIEGLLAMTGVFSIIISIAFIQSGHLAGRVARFSDYTNFTLGFLYVLRGSLGNARVIVIGLFALAQMWVFSSIYLIG